MPRTGRHARLSLGGVGRISTRSRRLAGARVDAPSAATRTVREIHARGSTWKHEKYRRGERSSRRTQRRSCRDDRGRPADCQRRRRHVRVAGGARRGARALAEQSGPPFEVVVADDGSGPETARSRRPVAGDRLRDLLSTSGRRTTGSARRASSTSGPSRRAGTTSSSSTATASSARLPGGRTRRAALPGWFLASKRLHLERGALARVLDETTPVWRWSAARVARPGAARGLRVPPRGRQPRSSCRSATAGGRGGRTSRSSRLRTAPTGSSSASPARTSSA